MIRVNSNFSCDFVTPQLSYSRQEGNGCARDGFGGSRGRPRSLAYNGKPRCKMGNRQLGFGLVTTLGSTGGRPRPPATSCHLVINNHVVRPVVAICDFRLPSATTSPIFSVCRNQPARSHDRCLSEEMGSNKRIREMPLE